MSQNTNQPSFSFDALIPADMALKAQQTGIKKAALGGLTTFALAVLAGAFIALGAVFCTTIMAGSTAATGATEATSIPPYGVTRLLGGLTFCLGLILVVVAGAELFTGNNLIVMAWANRQVSTSKLLRNWVIVYLGNFVGSIATAIILFLSKQYISGNNAVGLTALSIANTKAGLDFIPALMLGVMCNALVCLAIWLCFSARSTTDKILSILFPITAFVAIGFEHSIANMYFIPIGLLIKEFAAPEFWDAIGKTTASYSNLTVDAFFLKNLLPVTIGNIIGGAGMVGVMYWFVYLRPKAGSAPAPAAKEPAQSDNK